MQEIQDENMPLSDMKERLRDMKKRIMTLEWDKSHNQLNSSMELKYSQIKTECETLQKKVDTMQAELKGQEATAAAKIEQVKAAE
ncbi:hypothetical protein HYU40_03850 [Candidatus Woesearchaeota archaeon]|nr:hypothetical protein [Candidatus Woesearchaeota archaeon]